jgi:hypothetical protein
MAGHVCRGASDDDLATADAAFRAQVDDSVGGLYHHYERLVA